METYLTYSQRDEILNKILEFAKKHSAEDYHYSYAFGYISAVLTDQQLRGLEKGLN